MRRLLSGSIYALSAAIGVVAFLYPFFLPNVNATPMGMGHSHDAPIVTVALVGLALVALVIEVQGQALGAKTIAVLGVLVAIISALRFIEVVMPLPGGFSPVFAPIILTGYAFGARFGFLIGTFTLLASALITGGVGPWLPYQMFTAGWVGMSAGWLARLRLPGRSDARTGVGRVQIAVLVAFGFVWGLLFGAVMNLFFWPFAVGPAQQTWRPGIGLAETLARYGVFYLATSLGWDLARAVGNAVLLVLLGGPVLRALLRFRRRFHFEVMPGA